MNEACSMCDRGMLASWRRRAASREAGGYANSLAITRWGIAAVGEEPSNGTDALRSRRGAIERNRRSTQPLMRRRTDQTLNIAGL